MRQALGKGLGALIPEKTPIETEKKKAFQICGIEEIEPNPFQPRKKFNEAQIQELVDSIKEKGILQPLVVRRKGTGYELIAGERRWRAAQKAGLKEVPIIIKDATETELLEFSLIENIQRENLNPIEEAEAFRKLIDQFHLTQEEISKRVGKDRATIANALRLLRLPQDIKESLAEGQITVGHARAFLSLESLEKQRAAFKQVLTSGLSVRQTERLVKRLSRKASGSIAAKKSPDWEELIEELQKSLGTKVRIKGRGDRGRIEIDFYSREELDRLIDLLRR
ncbi:MAG: ParB/RepB/Spo0J family partition protein [Thermodesulfobacteriota bacterium]